MSSSQDSDPRHSWYRGAAISALGVLIGTIAFGTFCYAFGLNFSDEGWSDSHDQPWQTHRTQLIGSLIGFTIAILLFWLGFIQTTRSRS
jgi:hypothetical protein